MTTTTTTTPAIRRPRPAHLTRGALVVPAVLAALGLFLIYGNLTMDVVGDGGLFGPTTMPWAVAALSLVVAVLLAIDILRPRPEYDSPALVGTAAPGSGAAGTSGAGSDAARSDAATGDAAPGEAATGEAGTDEAANGAAADEAAADEIGADDEGVNAVAVLTAVAGVVGFIVVLPWLGWILAATGLFVAVAAALGNRRWGTVVLAGLALSSVVQIAFSMLLGISLPSGFVGGF